MTKLLTVLFFYFLISCNNIDFVYKDKKNVANPLYQKTEVNTSGVDLNFINSYLPMFFGNNIENTYKLLINIKEKKTKRSVETNQATSNLRFELRFNYTLISDIKDCIIFEKEMVSYFSIIPKSEGYNYGTDASLEKKYELAVTENLNQFVSLLSDIDIDSCS